ncbi:hypothetical protein J9B83_01385 [Marinomonas sp. A79]|uniref:Glycosyl transferase family 28 C-terminal domain-containing protein n=1 Tax=Marinomonas vulgaris TaxID=2823372 RepID=A0ABS5H7Q9_9GAMM|nr:glycosyltransferase [Marinomonas vulgaris]MBR7887575.1 hypothetical protein [Marinomonas vulgaris]
MERVSIFLTVGSQLPFDRLVGYCEELEQLFPDKYEVFYQTACNDKTSKDNYTNHLNMDDFSNKVEESDIIVTHAGIGSIITSLLNSKYIIVVPREYQYGEHRNDHQIDTSLELKNINVARNMKEFLNYIEAYSSKKASLDIYNKAFYSKLNGKIKSLLK